MANIALAIPHYNRPYDLTECVAAILKYSENHNLILVIGDDCSDHKPNWDFIQSMIEESDQRFFKYEASENQGLGKIRHILMNCLMSVCTDRGTLFEYAGFIDDDFFVRENYFDKIIEALGDPRWGAAGGYSKLISEWDSSEIDYQSKVPFWAQIPYENCIMKMDTWIELGNFDSELRYFDDTDLMMRLQMMGLRYCMVPGANCIQDWRRPGGCQSVEGGKTQRNKDIKKAGKQVIIKYPEGACLLNDTDLDVNWNMVAGIDHTNYRIEF